MPLGGEAWNPEPNWVHLEGGSGRFVSAGGCHRLPAPTFIGPFPFVDSNGLAMLGICFAQESMALPVENFRWLLRALGDETVMTSFRAVRFDLLRGSGSSQPLEHLQRCLYGLVELMDPYGRKCLMSRLWRLDVWQCLERIS